VPIAEIDGLRGIAILLVMVHRLWPRAAMSPLAEVGWIGVDLFFVVSGFLITRILLSTRDDPDYFRNFYARRVLRIFPLYYAFVGVALATVGGTAGSPAWYLLFLGNVPEGVLGIDPPYWLAPLWSLAIEEQFYLTFPHVVRRLDRRSLVCVLVAMIALAPVFRVLTLVEWPDKDRLQYLFTPCRVDAIAAGCLLGVLATSPRFGELRQPFAAVVLAAAVVAVMTGLDRTTVWGCVGGYSVVALGFAALVGAVLCARGHRSTAILRVPALRYLGKLCFGLYLLHRPADTLTTAVALRLGWDATVGLAWVPVKMAVAIVLASVSWFGFETRFLRLKRHFKPAVAVAFVAACSTSPAAPVSGESPLPQLPRKPPPPPPPGSSGGAVAYTFDRTQSPITPSVARGLQAIAAPARSDDVFAKVGDSITALPAFATCFDAGYDLGRYAELAATRAYYDAGNAAGATPFSRASDAATGGWTAADVLAGPLDQELASITPRLAIILIGTNDDRYGRALAAYGADLWAIVDRTIATGAIPLLSTLPPLHSDPDSEARVPVFNLVVRAIAQGRQIPLVDFYREMLALPGQGIGSDGVHPTTSPDGACSLADADLAYGFDVRNLVTLQALDRARAALAGNAPDAFAPLRDRATSTLPLADLADTRTGESAMSTCTPASGHQIVYTLRLPAPATFDVYAFARDGTGATIQIVTAGSCVAAGAGTVTASAPAGSSYLLVAPGGGTDGELVVIAQPH
jgi:peptidoglycan/LPS O-acetylase OafA/YrhL